MLLQVEVCVVSAVSFNGKADCTNDPLVRESFKEAVFVSTGIPTRYVVVATPTEKELCGVDLTQMATTSRRLSTNDAVDIMPQHRTFEQQVRRSELFGVSDVDTLRLEVATRLDASNRWTLFVSLPVIQVYFSVTSNVQGLHLQ